MNPWHSYRARFIKSMASLHLNVVEWTTVAVLFAMMGLHILMVLQAGSMGGAEQIRLARIQAGQPLMASRNLP